MKRVNAIILFLLAVGAVTYFSGVYDTVSQALNPQAQLVDASTATCAVGGKKNAVAASGCGSAAQKAVLAKAGCGDKAAAVVAQGCGAKATAQATLASTDTKSCCPGDKGKKAGGKAVASQVKAN